MSNELEKQLAVLKENYLKALPEKINEIRSLWLSASSTGDEEHVVELHRKAHSLAGSGATFDQIELSKTSKKLELFVKQHSEDGDLFSENIAIEVNAYIDNLANSYAEKESEIPEPENVKVSEVDSNSTSIFVEKMRILIADDDDDNRQYLETILKSAGHEVVTATDGVQAIKIFQEQALDIILMDVIMPNLTGYDAARKIKQETKNRFVPILFLTAVTDIESLAGCIEAGGDDFINKPVHPIILNAKLSAFQRIIKMYDKLDEYQKKNEEEMEASKKVLESVIFSNDKDIDGLQSWAMSPGHFSGDTRLFRKMDNGHVYVLLCDFTGHGLPAAIGTVFVSDLFRSMTSKNIPAIEILNEINAKMNQILPTGRYCAAIMMDYSTADNSILLWNCGLPSAYLTDKNRKIEAEYASQSVPLGVLPGKISADPYEIDTHNKNEIVIFSDGITEAENPNGEMFGEEKLKSLIQNTSAEKDLFSEIKSTVESFMDGEEPGDDISLIVYKFK